MTFDELEKSVIHLGFQRLVHSSAIFASTFRHAQNLDRREADTDITEIVVNALAMACDDIEILRAECARLKSLVVEPMIINAPNSKRG